MPTQNLRILRAEFVYKDDVATNPLTKDFAQVTAPPQEQPATLQGIAIDTVVGLVGKAAESLIDAAAARLQPEATTLEAIIPLNGFYQGGRIAVEGGWLVFHNGIDASGKSASIIGVFQLFSSADGTAFRFTVARWQHGRFLGDQHWLQSRNVRDFALKVEFLTPGSTDLGTRSAFLEHVFDAVTEEELGSLFLAGQKLQWLAAPNKPSSVPAVLTQPLNVRVTLVETSKPNQFGLWIQELAKERKADLVSLTKDAVDRAINPNYAASQTAKLAEASGAAFSAYKSAWNDLATHKVARPADLQAGASEQDKALHDAALADWTVRFRVELTDLQAKLVLARTAFDAAGMPWPGDLPTITPT